MICCLRQQATWKRLPTKAGRAEMAGSRQGAESARRARVAASHKNKKIPRCLSIGTNPTIPHMARAVVYIKGPMSERTPRGRVLVLCCFKEARMEARMKAG